VIDDCILDSTADAGKSNVNSAPDLSLFPSECPTPAEQPMSTFSGSQNSSGPTQVPGADVGYMPLKDISNLSISITQGVPNNVTDVPTSKSIPEVISKDYPFIDLGSDIVDRLTFTMMYGPQKLFRMENSVKKVMAEMEQVGELSDERLSQVLGPAVRLLIKESPLEGYIDATVCPRVAASLTNR